MRETRRNTQAEGGQRGPCLVTHRVSWRTLDALLSLRSGRALPKEAMRSWGVRRSSTRLRLQRVNQSGAGDEGMGGMSVLERQCRAQLCVCRGAVRDARGHSLWLLWLLWGQQVPVK